MACYNCFDVEIVNTTFKQNRAGKGGLYYFGLIDKDEPLINITVSNCIFQENFAPDGGLIYSLGGTFNFSKSTFDSNECYQGCII